MEDDEARPRADERGRQHLHVGEHVAGGEAARRKGRRQRALVGQCGQAQQRVVRLADDDQAGAWGGGVVAVAAVVDGGQGGDAERACARQARLGVHGRHAPLRRGALGWVDVVRVLHVIGVLVWVDGRRRARAKARQREHVKARRIEATADLAAGRVNASRLLRQACQGELHLRALQRQLRARDEGVIDFHSGGVGSMVGVLVAPDLGGQRLERRVRAGDEIAVEVAVDVGQSALAAHFASHLALHHDMLRRI